jgi:hypothetical protein
MVKVLFSQPDVGKLQRPDQGRAEQIAQFTLDSGRGDFRDKTSSQTTVPPGTLPSLVTIPRTRRKGLGPWEFINHPSIKRPFFPQRGRSGDPDRRPYQVTKGGLSESADSIHSGTVRRGMVGNRS